MSSVLSVLNRFIKVWIVNWKKRTQAQLPEEECYPESAESYGADDAHPLELEMAAIKLRHNQPVEIDEPHYKDEQGYCRQHSGVTLQISLVQDIEGERVM